MSELIKPDSQLDYCAFADASISCYQLSDVQLTFCGKLDEPSEYSPPFLPHSTDLFKLEIYKPYTRPHPEESLTEENRPNVCCAHLAEVSWRHFLPYGQDVAIVGYCTLNIRIHWASKDYMQQAGVNDLLQVDQHRRFYFHDCVAHPLSSPTYINPETEADIETLDIHGRTWLKTPQGNTGVHRKFHFTTALTSEHLLVLDLCPTGYWAQGTEPPADVLEKVMVSFWDFMSHLNIVDDPEQQGTPGIELKGDMLARFEYEQEQAKAREAQAQNPTEEDDGMGW